MSSNVFIWKYVEQVSDSYHSGGGLVVFAATETRARELANSKDQVELPDDMAPDEVRAASGDEKVFVFIDAGCC